jgi:hypothetical protein
MNKPHITPELVLWLEASFPPVLDTRGVDLREIDFRSGQYSVVTTIKSLLERQTKHGSERSPGPK